MDSVTVASDPVYFALTGDIVASRELDDRAAVQRNLRDALHDLNTELGDAVAIPFEIIAGDAVQGLLREPAAAAAVVIGIADALHPVAIMWGLGRGPLATDLADEISLADGPCLHRAREALEAAVADDRWLAAAGFAPPHDEVLTALFRMMWAVRSGWTETQARYVRGVRDRNQTQVAELSGVSKQAVSKVLDAARFAAVREAEDAARALLAWLGGRAGGAAT